MEKKKEKEGLKEKKSTKGDKIGVMSCPLCFSHSVNDFYSDRLRAYFRCKNCQFIFVDPLTFLPPKEEKKRYTMHQNNPADPEYRQFLNRLAQPLSERLGNKPLAGLDFGSGPGPTLSTIMEAKGYSMTIYDPFFADNHSALAKQYDFIACTETVEHFYEPGKEWRLLLQMLKPTGWLGIMTGLVTDELNFAQWHYKNDPTHVGFFSRKTFRYLAKRDALKVEFINNNVILLRKSA